MSEMQSSTEVRAQIMGKIAELAGTDPAELVDASTLDSLGLDSSDAVILALEIEEATGHEIDAAVFLRCATIGEAATEIARLIAK